MTETEQTQQQIERFLRKVAQKFTANDCDMPMTDIHLKMMIGIISQSFILLMTTLLLSVATSCMIWIMTSITSSKIY